MAMNMRRAFSSKFYTKLEWYSLLPGHYNATNDWIEGASDKYIVKGVIREGNRQTQMDDGIGLKSTDGGARYGDYMTLYIRDHIEIKLTDKMAYKGKYYNILRMSDLETYGYRSYLMERTKTWSPS